MDPALEEMLKGNGDDEIEAIIRLRYPGLVPRGVRIVAQFGDIATCRLKRNAIQQVHEDEACASLKAPRLLISDAEFEVPEPATVFQEDSYWHDDRRPKNIDVTGRGVVIGIVDWGFDFMHPDFLHDNGSTRLLALWDQSQPRYGASHVYGYGTIYTEDAINRALLSDDPYVTLGYHPANGDPDNMGAHGTHVAGIAAGNGRAGGPVGIAPEADLVFVHLSTRGTDELANLGDSVTLLEAIDFISKVAGKRPCVINCSIGRTGGAKDGKSPVERGLDAFLQWTPGRAICQSTGNYFQSMTHASGKVKQGESVTLNWLTDAADRTPNEMEIWYSGRDKFIIEIVPPNSDPIESVPLGKNRTIEISGVEVGRIYHRDHDPNNGDNHVDIFLYPEAPAGRWQVNVIGEGVAVGDFHAWIERDAACQHCQSRFDPKDADTYFTTGTICNGFYTIAVGAYNPHSPDRQIGVFSSSGPTRDGRKKPNLAAPGVSILAPRSAHRDPEIEVPLYVRRSGTSMAAPHVTGACALVFQAAKRPLRIDETHKLLLDNTDSNPEMAEDAMRIGAGYLNIERAVNAVRKLFESEQSDNDKVVTQEKEQKQFVCKHMNNEEAFMKSEQLDQQVKESNKESITAEKKDNGIAVSDSIGCCSKVLGNVAETIEECPDEKKLVTEEMIEDYSKAVTPRMKLIEIAKEDLSLGEFSQSPGDMLRVLPKSGLPEGLNPFTHGNTMQPALIFDAFTGKILAIERHLREYFDVVALPGESITELKPGDLMVRRGLGQGMMGNLSLIATGEMLRKADIESRGMQSERGVEGIYAHVIEAGPRPHHYEEQFARRIGNIRGNLLTDTILLRPRLPDTFLLRPLPPGRLSREAEAEPGHADCPIAEDSGFAEQPAPSVLAGPDSFVADRFVAAHPTRFCTPGQTGSATCQALAAPRPIRRVIIHVIAVPSTALRTGVEAVIAGWQNAGRQASSHYLVDRDGTITQMVREADVAFHTPGNNRDSIGIEHADVCNDPTPLTTQLYERSASLVRDLATRYGFAINNNTVAGHSQVNPNHGDPGPYWDWEYYLLLLAWDGTSVSSRPLRLVTAVARGHAAPTGWQVQRRRAIPNDHCASRRDPWGSTYWRTQPSATGTAAELSLVVEDASTYKLSLWWPDVAGANLAVLMDIEVGCLTSPCTGTSSQTVTVNQRQNAGRWNDVAVVSVTQTPSEVKVRWRRDSAQRGWILADGVRLLKISS